ncbi:Glutamate 5-kinase [Sulfurovum sp. enrichment culture clone C5]|uniref:Glutamate 5-kinase n=1 Tax=Sulfurovum sp. enrichment culture clone C5 TaxID=497650 RepID=A0A0S4XPC8_9BACT|nr:Glutamate 5-kinase [Sulfurovum sp. enrichment culture clone C5]
MNRIVIKVGSHVLTENAQISKTRMKSLVELIATLQQNGNDVILVSSGAVSSGYTKLNLDKKFIPNRQALAAIGQPLLLRMYQEKFDKFDIICSQVLLSAADFDSKKRTNHAKNAIDVLLANKVVPIINENDVTATEELVFGDNDRLSAHVAYHFDADILVILSDIAGYYDKDPNKFNDAVMYKTHSYLSEDVLNAEHSANNEFATGGIVTKLQSAQFLLENGKEMFLASGFDLTDVKSFLLDGVQKGGTLFCTDI